MTDLLTTASDAAEAYLIVLNEMQQTTDLLIASLKDWDESNVALLMDARWELCKKIGEHSNNLRSAARQIELSDAGSDTSSRHTFMVAMETVRQAEKDVLKTQLECESILSAQVESCRADAAGETNRRSLTSAYSKPDRGHEARFLDSRL